MKANFSKKIDHEAIEVTGLAKFPIYIGKHDGEAHEYKGERNFKAGDILVASDNVGIEKTGYVGHSAISIDVQNLIESAGGHPAILEDTNEQLTKQHSLYAHYRPKSAELGQKAAQWAIEYLAEYKINLAEGVEEPIFSFWHRSSLREPWDYIYCSKLVWLAYYFGAGYKFKNDFLWFSPEDLEANLEDNDDFKLLYKHKDYHFKLNT